MSLRLRLFLAALAAIISFEAWAAPNFVLIITDDQRVDDLAVMPKTRQMIGGQGTTFNRFYVAFPFCCPSRATMYTGQYPHNHGVLDNEPPLGGYQKFNNSNTLAVWLKEKGYFTAHIGKFLNGYGINNPREVPPGWTDWQGLVDPTTYAMYDYTINDNGTLVRYGSATSDYQTDVLAKRAEETINEAVASNKPFFIDISTLAPHGEDNADLNSFYNPRPAPRHSDKFLDKPLPKPPSFNEQDVSDKPAFIRKIRLLGETLIKRITDRYHARQASLLAVDDLVGRVVNALKNKNVLSNTIIFFTSDNGYFQGEHRIRSGKIHVYEESSLVPLFVRGPGFTAGKKEGKIVSNVDLAPTIVALAGAQARLQMDGRSLLQPLSTRAVLIETTNYRAVRDNGFAYVEYDTGKGAVRPTPGQRELRSLPATEPACGAELCQHPHNPEEQAGQAQELFRSKLYHAIAAGKRRHSYSSEAVASGKRRLWLKQDRRGR
jgi:arylsulfatase A-like enzyme